MTDRIFANNGVNGCLILTASGAHWTQNDQRSHKSLTDYTPQYGGSVTVQYLRAGLCWAKERIAAHKKPAATTGKQQTLVECGVCG